MAASELQVHEAWGPDPDTTRLFYDHVKDAPDLLIHDGDDLDRKGVALLSAASVVLGLASFGRLSSGAAASVQSTVALAIAGVAYVFTVVKSMKLLAPTTYKRSKHADDFWAPGGRWATPAELMEFFIESAQMAYAANKIIVKRKAGAVGWIVWGTAAEVLAVVAAVVLARIFP